MQITPRTIHSFLSATECADLAAWITANKTQPFFGDAGMHGNRVTTRYSTEGFSFPQISFDIQRKLSNALAPLGAVLAPFKDGMVASCAYPGDKCYRHIDPVWQPEHTTVHCNVVVASPESGGEAIVDGKEYPMRRGDLFCYPVSKLLHEVLLVGGIKPRLMWVFGFCVPDTVTWEHVSDRLAQVT